MSNASDFVIENGVLVKYKGSSGDVVIPDGVTVIGNRAFAWCKGLEAVTIPQSVTTIGDSAFCYCGNLRSVVIPENVTTIKRDAFSNCRALTSVTLTESLVEIENGAFSSCKALTQVQLPAGLKRLGQPKQLLDSGVFQDSGVTEIEIPQNMEYIGYRAFKSCTELRTITVPGSIVEIADGVFRDCSNLKTITMCEGIMKIGNESFANCTGLESMIIPESVAEIGEDAFLGCSKINETMFPPKLAQSGKLGAWGIADENGCMIVDKVLRRYCKEASIVRIPEGVETIDENVFSHLFSWSAKQVPTEIVLPDSLQCFKESNLSWKVKINIPKGFLQRRVKQPSKFLTELLKRQWKDQPTLLDYACVLMFQGGKDLLQICQKQLEKDIQKSTEAFLEATRLGLKGPEYVKAAEFFFEHKDRIAQETIDALYAAASADKAKKAVDLLKPIATEEEDAPQKCAKAVAQHPIEEFCQEQFVEHYLDKTVKKANLYAKSFEGVLYKGSEKKAPAFVVKCAIVPYMALMEERPKHIGGYKTDHLSVNFIENADKVAAELDPMTFIQALEKIASVDFLGYDKPQCLIPLCRYGNENHIKELVSKLRQWENWNSCGSSGRSAIIVARGAIMLNDSREAMLYIEKCKKLYVYARMRGMDEDVLRDTKLAEFGLDANGCKIFDLGNTTIEASVGQDLAISLYDVTAKKVVKSLPKKGTDPDKHAAASAQLSDLKKNLKKVVKSRNDILFERFLDGKTQKAPGWIASYTKNPVLHRVAELIVWNQKKNTFILTKNGAVDCDGNTYIISDGSPVGVAHPKDMTKAELVAWQKYFTSHGLKQPFEQIWEPVVDSKSIQTDRYKGCMIPFFQFKGREKHGIFIQDWDFHNQIDISFEGCDANVERIDWRRHDIGMNDRFEIKSFSIGRNMTRKANHIVAYLDRITVRGRILNDDVSVVGMLPMFTLAQIMEFINAASENNCTNILAVLMDYKNRTFIGFDPMEEFSLDL